VRIRSVLLGAAALAFSGAAAAQTIESISYSPEFQTAIEEDFGAREGEYLNEALTRYVCEALQRRDAASGDVRIELSIIDAAPNRPTMGQLSANPSLDAIHSISVGGAELRAVLRDGSGAVVAEVDYRYYAPSLRDASFAAGTWSDARRSMRRFAEKVADAYVAHAGAD
jgi:hypothetical protein